MTPWLTPWSSAETNFPAGGNAWNGQPLKVAPAQDYFSPNIPLPAENVNYRLNLVDNSINSLATYVTTPNWHNSAAPNFQIDGNANTGFYGVAWDPITLKWLVASASASNVGAVTGRGDPNAWTQVAGTASAPVGFAPAGNAIAICRGIEPSLTPPSKYVYVAGEVSGGGLAMGRGDTSAGSWNGSAMAPLGVITDCLAAALLSVSGVIVLAVGSSGIPHSNVYFSSNSGSTWTAQSAMPVTVAINGWALQQGGGLILAVPLFSVAGNSSYITSANGTTWTAHTLPAASVETPFGLCYGTDAAGVACWVMTTQNTSTFATLTYRSYDGVTWSNFSNNLPLNLAPAPITAFGGFIFMMSAVGGATAQAQILYSVDGGATWNANTEISRSGSISAMAAGPNQAMAVSGAYIAASLCYGPPGGIGSQ